MDMINTTYKAGIVEKIIKLSVDPNNKEESLKLLRDLLMKETNGGKLYKYRGFDEKGHNIAIIENQTMYCSNPSAFNDPFDCKIGIDLESITDAMCGAELESIQTLFDNYVDVVKGEKALDEYDYSERKAIEALLENEVFNSLRDNKSLVSEEEITEYIQKNPKIIFSVMKPLLEVSGLNNRYPLIDAEMDGLAQKLINKETIAISDKKVGLTEFFKASGINADVDQISMAKRWAESLKDSKLTESAGQIDVMLKSMEEQIQAKMNDTFCIGSLASDYKNRLMWSHYADEHRGFCIEFDFSKGPEDCLPLPVVYSEKRVKMPWVPTQNPSKEQVRFMTESFMKALVTKDIVWEYEHEWRMLIGAGDDKFVNMPPISCIYIGALCSDENEQKLRAIAQGKGIPLKQMVLDRGEYELHVVDCM